MLLFLPSSGCLNASRCFRWLGFFVALWTLAGAVFAERLPEPFAGEPSFYVRPWAVDDGTTANSVMSVVRRADGYLWVVTRTGVFRFDGVKFQPLPKIVSDITPDVFTPTTLMDRRKRLWLCKTGGTVACVDEAGIRVYTPKDGLGGGSFRSIVEDKDGAIWVSYTGFNNPCRIQDGRVHTIETHPSPMYATALASDSKGQIWFAKALEVGFLRDGGMLPLHKFKQEVIRIETARKGGVWCSDGADVWRCEESGVVEKLGRIPAGKLKVLFEDRRGRLWVAASKEAPASEDKPEAVLFYYDGRNFKQVPVSCPGITSMSDDDRGNLWLSTRRAGLIQVREQLTKIVQPIVDASPGVQSFCETGEGTFFATGNFGMLTRWRGAAWERMTPQHGWPGGVWCTSLVADSQGGAWLGTRQNGIFRWRDGKFSRISAFDKMPPLVVQALLAAANGDLWVGMDSAETLFRLRDGKVQTLPLPPEHGNVCAMAEDASGTIWVATDTGLLLRSNGDALLNFTSRISSSNEAICSLHCSPDGSLWIGFATRGLGRFKQGRFTLFGKEQRIEEQSISQIQSDDSGWLWCGGNTNIFRLKLEDLEAAAEGRLEKLQPVFSGRGEGWPRVAASVECWPRVLRNRAGEICMATSAGLMVIRPESKLENPMRPTVMIERVSLNGQPFASYESHLISEPQKAAPLLDLKGLHQPVSLGRGVRQLGVEFGLVSMIGQANVRYLYRLEGLDDNWVDARDQHVAYFSQLPPGKYRFQVSACSNEGIWNEAGVAFAFKVEPYYWQTIWFRIGAMLAALLLTVGVIMYFARRRLRIQAERLRQQQALVRERARIAEDLHDDLGARLTEVSLIGSLGVRPATSLEKAQGYLKEVAGKSREMVEALDEIVWAVNPKRDDIPSVTSYLIHYAERFFEPTTIHCRLDVAADIPSAHMSSEQRHELFLAFKEALSNVARHSSATEVRLRVFVHDGIFRVQIEDNGCGLPDKPDAKSGDGMSNMRMRLIRMGGCCDVESADGKGTKVEFAVPLSDAGQNGKETAAHLSGNNGDEVR